MITHPDPSGVYKHQEHQKNPKIARAPMRFLFQLSSLDRADRIQLYLSYTLQLILVAQVVYSLLQRSWLTLFLSSGILILTFLPAIIRRNFRVYLPIEIDLATILFIFASLFLGEMRSYYTRFWWWDLVLHTGAGILMGLTGFILVYILNRERKSTIQLSPFFVGLFSFSFAMTIGVLWEIFEFAMDQFFGMNMQKSGLLDTMGDLIVNTLGALLISIAGYFYVKGDDSLIFDRMVRRLLERNFRIRRASR